MAATTVKEFTSQLVQITSDSKVRVELRKNGGKYWVRATPDVHGAGSGAVIGTIRLQQREQTAATGNWGSWATKKSKDVTAGGGQQWTDENYTPPGTSSQISSVQVRAQLYSSYLESGTTENSGAYTSA